MIVRADHLETNDIGKNGAEPRNIMYLQKLITVVWKPVKVVHKSVVQSHICSCFSTY